MSHLHTAYQLGALHAQTTFEKHAAGADVATPIAGAIHPALAGLVGGISSPEGQGWRGGAGAGVGSLLGQVGGGIGGGLLGASAGGGLGYLLDKYDLADVDPQQIAAGGAGLGALLGAMGGGAYGAYKGRRATVENQE